MQTGAIYIRVSTNEQTEFSPDAQKRQILEYAKRNDILISNEFVFVDEGISGRKAEKRPEFMRMIATAKKKPKPFDVILVHKFDRFARSREDSIVYKSLLRKECDIKVISITEQLEDDKFSVILEAMLEAMAEYYSLNLADEVKKGMTEKALRGEFQSIAPFGYTMQSGKLIIDPKKADLVKLIYNEYLHNNSTPFKIARLLNQKGCLTNRNNKFESRTVTYILKNPIYVGYVRWNVTPGNTHVPNEKSEWIVEKGNHEPLINQDMFDAVQERFQRSHKPKSRPRDINKHWLSGILKCSNCGKSLVYYEDAKRKGFQCWLYSKGQCSTSHYVSEQKIVKAFSDSLKEVLESQNFNYSIKSNTSDAGEIDILNKELSRLATRNKRAKEAYLNGIDSLDEYRSNKELLQKSESEIHNRILSLRQPKTEIAKQEILNKIQNLHNIIISENPSKEDKNAALSSVVSEIIYNKPLEQIDVYYYY